MMLRAGRYSDSCSSPLGGLSGKPNVGTRRVSPPVGRVCFPRRRSNRTMA